MLFMSEKRKKESSLWDIRKKHIILNKYFTVFLKNKCLVRQKGEEILQITGYSGEKE